MKERNLLEGIANLSNFCLEHFYIRFKNAEWLVYIHNPDDQLTVAEYIYSQEGHIVRDTIQHKGRAIDCFQVRKKEILTWIRDATKIHRYHLVFHRKLILGSEWKILKPTDKII